MSIIRVTPILTHRSGRPDWGVVAIWKMLRAPVERVANHDPPVSACSLDDAKIDTILGTGGSGKIRTCDQGLMSPLLYH